MEYRASTLDFIFVSGKKNDGGKLPNILELMVNI